MDIRDKTLLILCFAISLVALFMYIFYDKSELLLTHRMFEILLECSIALLLGELLLTEIKQN